MKDWIKLSRKDFNNNKRNKNWKTLPMISITKTYITFSPAFVTKYIQDDLSIRVLYVDNETDGRFLGVRLVPRGDEVSTDFKISTAGTQTYAKACYLPNSFMLKLRDLKGRCFLATQDRSSKIIEIELSEVNEVK